MRLELLVLPSLALLVACEKAVTVVSPDSYPNHPVTEIKVHFSQHFKPGSFRAKLDGQDVTSLFAPAPVPGGEATMQIPALECGFENGETTPPSPPPPMRPVGVDTNARSAGPPSSGGAVQQAQPQSPNAAPAPVPPPPSGLTVFWHRIIVDGGCSGGRICEGDERPFLPPHLVGIPIKLPLYKNEPQRFQVSVWPVVAAPIGVKVRPEISPQQVQSRVNLGAGPDAPVSTIVPAGGQSPYIPIVGLIEPTTYVLRLCAPGTQRGAVTGPIQRRP